jgi:5-methylthioadenosine/S-adenosylhomocysteine deaminase
MMRVDVLIRGGIVLTMDPARRILAPGFVAIRDGRIVAVNGGHGEVFDAEETINASGYLVMPGLINAHGHLVQTLYRGLGDEYAQSAWPRHIVFRLSTALTADHAYNGARLALLELLKSGVTTTADSHFTHVHKDSIDGVCRAISESGVRAVVSRAAMDRSFGAQEEMFWEDIGIAVAETERVRTRWNSDRLQIVPEALSPQRCSPGLIQMMAAFADKTGTMWHMHVSSGKAEAEFILDHHGCGPVEYLDSLGVLSHRLLAAHCIWLRPQEIALLAQHNVKVAHNPVSNMYLGAGVAPVLALLAQRITVGLGVDGAATNNSQDMFETMKAAMLLQKVSGLSATIGSAEMALEMATLGSARALGLADIVGSLEPDKAADIVLLDANQPHLAPHGRLISNLVYSGKASGVRTVLVGGEVILRDGRHVRWDEDEIILQANESQMALLTATDSLYLLERSNWNVGRTGVHAGVIRAGESGL